MKVKQAAVIEPHATERRKLVDGLKKAGLTVTAAAAADALSREQLVVVGPTVKLPARVAQAIHKTLPEALVLAGQKKPGRAAWADGILPLPLSPVDLQVRLPELVALRERPARRSGGELSPRPGEGILDPLTSFYTFAHFKEVLFIEVKRARRYGFPLGFALVAFDKLPSRPSEELRSTLFGGLALAIRRSLRDTDYPVQYGPERVLLLMPHTDLQGALVVSRRIVERVGRATLSDGGTLLRPTISVGLAASNPQSGELAFADLARHAQAALEEAQGAGGNRVEFWDTAQEETVPGRPPLDPADASIPRS